MSTFIYTKDGKKLSSYRSTMSSRLTDHFTKEEFDCKCGCGNGDVVISQELVFALERVRVLHSKAMRITSGIRCLKHNRSIGSRDTSSHVKGIAADIHCTDMSTRLNLIRCILQGGTIKRIGINKDFIHVDVDSNKPSGIFTY